MSKEMDRVIECAKELASLIDDMELESKVCALNNARSVLHGVSPFKDEPVDNIAWVNADSIVANDYNPNNVAPKEMELLAHSINEDGYTQPIVTFQDQEVREVVDGFHRNRVGREIESVKNRVKGYLPVVTIKEDRQGRNDRIAATIRHNRARGKHGIESMSEIVIELKRRNWSPAKIGRELGMDQDEVLRLCQITGLAEMFSDSEFTEAWEADNETEVSSVLEVGGDVQHDVEDSTEQGRHAETCD